MPLHVSNTCAHHQEVKIALHSLWYHHTYRCDDTKSRVMQFWPPDDEHMRSKHVEAWNKLIVKQTFCASSWLITEINIAEPTKTTISASYRPILHTATIELIMPTYSLCTHFNVFNYPSTFFIYALKMFSNSLRTTKTDREMSELWKIEWEEYNFNVGVSVGFIVCNVFFVTVTISYVNDTTYITQQLLNVKIQDFKFFSYTHTRNSVEWLQNFPPAEHRYSELQTISITK